MRKKKGKIGKAKGKEGGTGGVLKCRTGLGMVGVVTPSSFNDGVGKNGGLAVKWTWLVVGGCAIQYIGGGRGPNGGTEKKLWGDVESVFKLIQVSLERQIKGQGKWKGVEIWRGQLGTKLPSFPNTQEEYETWGKKPTNLEGGSCKKMF